MTREDRKDAGTAPGAEEEAERPEARGGSPEEDFDPRFSPEGWRKWLLEEDVSDGRQW